MSNVLLDDGVRLFEQLHQKRIDLEPMGVIASPGVTHFRFRVVK